MHHALDTVLNDMDDIFGQIPDVSSHSHSHSHSHCHSHSSQDLTILTDESAHSGFSPKYTASSFMPTCDIDKYLMSASTLSAHSPRTECGAQSLLAQELKRDNVSIGDGYMKVFTPESNEKLQLKDHIFISKDCTYRLGQYVVKENWGKQCSLLYKYLDYIFRCQVFGRQIVEIHHRSNKKVSYLVFHSGLQRRTDNQFLYVVLIKNSISKLQDWRVAFGNIRNSFLSHAELIRKLKEHNIVIAHDKLLPQRTKFSDSLADLLYDDSFSIQANWEERLTTNQDRVFKVMGSTAFFDDGNKFLKLTDLIDAFSEALPKTQRLAQLNPRLAVAQGFVDTKHGKFRMELLVPIIIRFPRQNGNFYKFALAIGKSTERRNKYVVKSILTLEMAYANARLVGYVDSLWLHYGNRKAANQDLNDFCLNP
eukprot:CAMPEP_0197032686 /NCGR_PEP_ID=MMETSP1384-20130603/11300_1 /TAXON_ID=29189 /ORGANISM="Ammonia sp." /LENGTH=422 /DNA_ID=CAMNT_0042462383 /DNA_START=60 /DNA_END=1328 /DNA_ORIENTATION=-